MFQSLTAGEGGKPGCAGGGATGDVPTTTVSLAYRVGARSLGRVRLRLVQFTIPLEQALAGAAPELPTLPAEVDGYLLRAVPEAARSRLHDDGYLRPFVRQDYVRYYARLDQPFADYLKSLSSNTRAALKRKRRKLEERCGGKLDVRVYRHADEMEEFHRHARAVSALTYQERLLNAGLPEDSLGSSRALAEAGSLRAWLLFVDGKPVSYLYMPASGDTLVYRYLGYDPAFAGWSPGSVLQLEAMRMLMEERRFALLDFTEGDGQHKRQFASGGVPSIDLLLLRPRLSSLVAAYSLQAFDRSVAIGKAALARLRLGAVVRAVRR